MTENKIVRYIREHERWYSVPELSEILNVAEFQISKVVIDNDLQGFVKHECQQVVDDLLTSEKGKYSIQSLADKHCLKYHKVWQYLTDVGLKHMCYRRKNGSVKDHTQIMEWAKTYSVVDVARMAKEAGLRPCSRQGIYDLLKKNSINPIRKIADYQRNNLTGKQSELGSANTKEV